MLVPFKYLGAGDSSVLPIPRCCRFLGAVEPIRSSVVLDVYQTVSAPHHRLNRLIEGSTGWSA